MQKLTSGLILVSALLVPFLAQDTGNPFVGRWDFNIATANNRGAAWLGVTEKDGQAEVWYQPTGGNVYKVKDFSVEGPHLTLSVSPATANRPAMTWELDA